MLPNRNSYSSRGTAQTLQQVPLSWNWANYSEKSIKVPASLPYKIRGVTQTLS